MSFRYWDPVLDPADGHVLYWRWTEAGRASALGGIAEKPDGWHAYRYSPVHETLGVYPSRREAEAAVRGAVR